MNREEDIQRSMGRLEGQVSALTVQMTHFSGHLDNLDLRSAENHSLLKAVIAEKKGENRIIALIASLFGGGVAAAITWWTTK